MPKILILTNRIPYPLHDGGALAMDAMIRGYHEAGFEVHVLAMNTSRHVVEEDVLKRLYPQIKSFQWVAVDNSLSASGILKNLLFSRRPEHADRFRSKDFQSKLQELLQRVQPDIIQLESPFLASYLPQIRKSKALLIYRMHNIEGQIWSRLASQAAGLKKLYLYGLAERIYSYERQLWKDADLLLPITETDAETVVKSGINTPFVVAPFGIQTPDSIESVPQDFIKIYHIGAMDWLPNSEGIRWFLDEVWPTLHASAPALQFHFAGRAMPEAFFKNLPLGAFCDGMVKDAAAFVSDKHILIVPIQSGGGIRVKILEAMSRGKLVVGTSIGMQGIDAQNGIHYLKADTVDEFLKQLQWANQSPEKAADIASAGQKLILEHYNNREIMDRVTKKISGMLPISGAL